MALLVVHPGVSTTVQDRGRFGYRGFGVPVGGAFDRASFDLVNALLNNHPEAACLEMTLVGGSYRAEIDLAIALAGSPMSALIRSVSGPDRVLTIPQSTTLRLGDELVIGGTSLGARTYLGVRGGWRTPQRLGSRSSELRIEVGDVLPALPGLMPSRRPVAWPWEVSGNHEPIRVVDGPDDGGARLLEGGEYRVSTQSNRMGLRLNGPPLAIRTPADRVSAPVAPGAVQVAGDQPIVLGVAGGTMGGYLHLAHVITADLDRLAQLRPGDLLSFRRIEVEEARQIDYGRRLELARWLTLLRTQDWGLGMIP